MAAFKEREQHLLEEMTMLADLHRNELSVVQAHSEAAMSAQRNDPGGLHEALSVCIYVYTLLCVCVPRLG